MAMNSKSQRSRKNIRLVSLNWEGNVAFFPYFSWTDHSSNFDLYGYSISRVITQGVSAAAVKRNVRRAVSTAFVNCRDFHTARKTSGPQLILAQSAARICLIDTAIIWYSKPKHTQTFYLLLFDVDNDFYEVSSPNAKLMRAKLF